jgi:membrane-associated phospholipid phosphatase
MEAHARDRSWDQGTLEVRRNTAGLLWYWAIPAILLLMGLTVLLLSQGVGLVAMSKWPAQQSLFLSLNDALAALPAPLWMAVTSFGDALVLGPLLALLLIRRPQTWAALLATFPLGIVYSRGLKYLAGVPRPAAVLDHGLFHLVGPVLQSNSFPSGHTVTAFAAAAAVLATVVPAPRRTAEWALIGASCTGALAVALSRIAVGAHWPADLVAGAAGGWLAGLAGAAIAHRFRNWWVWLFLGAGRPVTAAVLMLWAFILWFQLSTAPVVAFLMGTAGVCAAGEGVGLLIASRRRRRSEPAPVGSEARVAV